MDAKRHIKTDAKIGYKILCIICLNLKLYRIRKVTKSKIIGGNRTRQLAKQRISNPFLAEKNTTGI